MLHPTTAGKSRRGSVPDRVTHGVHLTSFWASCSTLRPYSFFFCCSSLVSSTPKPKNRPPSPAAPKSRPLSPLVPAPASKTPTGKKTPPPGSKARPKRAQTPARVPPQTVAAVVVDKDHDLQQPDSPEEKKGECPSLKVTSSFWPTYPFII